jgi:hypothetical protein
MDLAFDNMYSMVVLNLNRGRGHFFNILGAPMILYCKAKKVYFLRLMRFYVDLTMLAAYFVIPSNEKWGIIVH